MDSTAGNGPVLPQTGPLLAKGSWGAQRDGTGEASRRGSSQAFHRPCSLGDRWLVRHPKGQVARATLMLANAGQVSLVSGKDCLCLLFGNSNSPGT